MSVLAQSPRPPLVPPANDPYYYGWREVARTRPDGSEYLESVPLTLEDVLQPQLGDYRVEAPLHDNLRDSLADVFRARTAHDPNALVVANCGIYWDDPDGEHHVPDLAVFFGLRTRDVVLYERNSYSVREHGVKPRIVVEIVSPHVRDNDVVKKFGIYHREEIPLYVIVDREEDFGPWEIIGYRYAPEGYIRLPNDVRGRLWLEDLDIWLGADGRQVLCYDGKTDEPIGDYVTLTHALEEKETQLAAEAARAEAERTARRAAEARIRELEAELARRQSS